MEHVLTLIAAPDHGLDPAAAALVRTALDALGADTAAAGWLSPGRACDIPFALLAPEQAEAVARKTLRRARVDLVAQPMATRRKKLLAADMDSTVILGETLDALAEAVGLKDVIAPMTAHAMNGEIDFATSLRQRVALLAGTPAAALDRVRDAIRPAPGARTLVATMRANGAHAVLVSGGFRCFTAHVRDLLGFDEDHGNEPGGADGVLDGTLAEPLIDAHGKLAALIATAGARKIPTGLALSVGDGANDLPMLDAAGLGVAFHAKPGVAARARARIDHSDLTALLYLQGYGDEAFVTE